MEEGLRATNRNGKIRKERAKASEKEEKARRMAKDGEDVLGATGEKTIPEAGGTRTKRSRTERTAKRKRRRRNEE